MGEYADVSLQGLEELQTQILRLSELLKEYHTTTKRMVNVVGQTWRDQQFERFVHSFSSKQDALLRISEDYNQWASGYLEVEINNIREYLGITEQ